MKQDTSVVSCNQDYMNNGDLCIGIFLLFTNILYLFSVWNILCKGQISWIFGGVHDTDSKG